MRGFDYIVEIHFTSKNCLTILQNEPIDFQNEVSCLSSKKNHYFKFVRPAKIESACRR